MKYVSCELAQHGICFINDHIWSCCYSPVEGLEGAPESIVLIKKYKGEKIDWDALFKLIDERRENFKKGIIPSSCQNCYWLKEQEWSDENYINQVYITHFEKCNANCFYCSGCQGRERDNKTKPYSVLPILKDMQKRGIMPKGSEIHIGGGEPTLYHELDSIIKEYALTNYVNKILIPTSGIIFSKVIYEALKKNMASIIISLDSGCRETYKKIKRVDKFNNIIKNISKYTKIEHPANVVLKYIIIPNFNSTKTEFDLFLKTIKKAGVKRIALDIEAFYAKKFDYKVNPKLIDFVAWAEDYAKSQGFETETYMFYKHILSFKNAEATESI